MDRYCTHCGELTDRKTSNLYVCRNGHENFFDPSPAAVVYILKDDEVLFGYRSIEPNKGGLNVPGGFINIGETAEQAALREVREELGIDITLIGLLNTYAVDYADVNKPVLCITFVAEYKSGDIVPGDDMNGGTPVWRTLDNLPAIDELAWEWQVQAQRDLQQWLKNKDMKTTGLVS